MDNGSRAEGGSNQIKTSAQRAGLTGLDPESAARQLARTHWPSSTGTMFNHDCCYSIDLPWTLSLLQLKLSGNHYF